MAVRESYRAALFEKTRASQLSAVDHNQTKLTRQQAEAPLSFGHIEEARNKRLLHEFGLPGHKTRRKEHNRPAKLNISNGLTELDEAYPVASDKVWSILHQYKPLNSNIAAKEGLVESQEKVHIPPDKNEHPDWEVIESP